jgi:hypothetical protein
MVDRALGLVDQMCAEQTGGATGEGGQRNFAQHQVKADPRPSSVLASPGWAAPTYNSWR